MAQLFANHEVNRAPRWPLLSRLLMASVVLHAIFFAAIYYIPTLQSMARVAGSFAGIKFVEHDYDETLIGERATLVKLSAPTEKLYYPAGYFGAPTETQAIDPAMNPMFVPQPTPTPYVFKPRPAPRPRVFKPQPVATPSPAMMPTPEIAKKDDKKDADTPSPEERAKSEDALNKIADEHKIGRPPDKDDVNLKPLKDLLNDTRKMLADGKISLDKTIDMTIEADLMEDGTLENPEIVNQQGDENLRDLAKLFVSRLASSAVLKFLNQKQMDIRHLTMTVKIDQQQVIVSVSAETASFDRATEIARGYGNLLAGARLFKQGKDEDKIWENMQVNSDGKLVMMKFQMPRDVATALLAKVPSG